jgi:hypothetical protein
VDGGHGSSGGDRGTSTLVDAGVVADGDASALDASEDVLVATDAAADGAAYPAFAPDVPQIQNFGGAVLTNPVLVTITWAGDPSASYFESFGDGLGSTQYWSGTVAEYGVGAASSGPANHVSLTTPPPTSVSDTDVATLIAANAGVPGSGWPAPTPNTMYVVYLPPGAVLLLDGQNACQYVGAYHDSLLIGGQNIAYSAIPQCEGGTGTVTLAASHEIGEGAADPHPLAAPAWIGFDQPHLAWDVFQAYQDEVADACEFYASSALSNPEPQFPYTVQRLWSNKKAAAGHNPCQPSDTGVYFNTTLIAPEDITVDMHENGGASNYATKGIHILPGTTRTFPLGFFSDAPTGGPWTIIAHNGNPVNPSGGSTSPLTMSLDRTTGSNGDTANLTVTVTAPGQMNAELVTIESRLGVNPSHWLPILIGSQ